jgi:Zn-dependent M16 (insulinase) family peptidase
MAFELRREASIPSMGATYQEFIDADSGSKHIHLKAESDENCFMVSFPTIPRADDGRAHILEHLALCGSAKYPTRDPFFAMTRRSLATFMNAMTAADHTMYPFASQGRKDFFNLLDVYLDAAFFPNLDRLDFLQEGWRLSPQEDGSLAYNGVVFNEMKEPMANADRGMWQGIQKALKPGTTYAFESGGDPLSIPQLSHEELKTFHAEHYHPSRATFWSYGDVDPLEIQARIESEVISKITTRLPRVSPDAAALPTAPILMDLPLPSSGNGAEHGFSAAWVIGDIGSDMRMLGDWQIFMQAIAGDSASPMAAALENAGFGRPGILHVDMQHRQATAHLGMDGLEAGQAQAARDLIFSTLEEIARDGIPEERLRSVLRDFEMLSVEVRGGSTPYGLRALMSMAPAELNGADPVEALDSRADLERAHESIKNPDFIKRMARHLLDSPARVEATLTPDSDQLPARERAEAELLARAQADMTPAQLEELRADSAALLARQRAEPDFSSLPKITPSDIEREPSRGLSVEFEPSTQGPARAFVEAPTNGVGYFSALVDASSLTREDWPWFTLGLDLTMQLGCGALNFQEAEASRTQRGASFGAGAEPSTSARGSESSFALRSRYGAKSLEREAGAMAQALAEALAAPRFDESERLAYLIQSSFQQASQDLSQSGAQLASWAAARAFGDSAVYSSTVGGLARLDFLRELDALSRSPEGMAQIQETLALTFDKLADAPVTMSYFGSRAGADAAFDAAAPLLANRRGTARLDRQEALIHAEAPGITQPVALTGPGQLNYCHAQWAAPKQGHPDVGPMMVLGAYLSNVHLHRLVREEGGAYGSGAQLAAARGAFGLSSYRDPRLGSTYADFEAVIALVCEGPISQDGLEEAIVSVMQSLDRPGSPADQARLALARGLNGLTFEDRQALRSSILDCSGAELARVAKTYLQGKPSSRAAYVCPKAAAEAEDLGMLAHPLTPAPAKRMKP